RSEARLCAACIRGIPALSSLCGNLSMLWDIDIGFIPVICLVVPISSSQRARRQYLSTGVFGIATGVHAQPFRSQIEPIGKGNKIVTLSGISNIYAICGGRGGKL